MTQKFFSILFTLKIWHFIFSTGIHWVLYPKDRRNRFCRGASIFLLVLGEEVFGTSTMSGLILGRGIKYPVDFVAAMTRFASLGRSSPIPWILSACCNGAAEIKLPHEMAIANRRKITDSILFADEIESWYRWYPWQFTQWFCGKLGSLITLWLILNLPTNSRMISKCPGSVFIHICLVNLRAVIGYWSAFWLARAGSLIFFVKIFQISLKFSPWETIQDIQRKEEKRSKYWLKQGIKKSHRLD